MARIIQKHLQQHPEILERAVEVLSAMSWNQS